jgi:hypothetical protein
MRQRIVVSNESDGSGRLVAMEASLFTSFMHRIVAVHSMGLKSYGVFLARPDAHELRPSEVHFFDPRNNRRNEADNRAAFEAQGAYFRRHHDAGFVVDAREVLALQNRARRDGLVTVAPFHTHRRQPANFSIIDYRLHNPLFSWHLVVSMRTPHEPRLQPFLIDKPLDSYGIESDVVVEGDGEESYAGPEVRPIVLVVEGATAELDAVEAVMSGHTVASGARAGGYAAVEL